MMNISPDRELVEICRNIAEQGRSIQEWAEIESDDMFQTQRYHGGFDAIEEAFCFSVYRADGEYWFQFTLEQANAIAEGKTFLLTARPAQR
jgi:hypothetical protein